MKEERQQHNGNIKIDDNHIEKKKFQQFFFVEKITIYHQNELILFKKSNIFEKKKNCEHLFTSIYKKKIIVDRVSCLTI